MSGQMGLPLDPAPKSGQAPEKEPSASRWGSKDAPATVAELVNKAHQHLQVKLPAMWIEGELSGLRRPSSGHLYFTLKDEQAQLPAAMWRSAASKVRFNLKDGLKVRVYGRVGIYAAQGKFQCYAERIVPAGEGDKMAELLALKKKLAAEGLFDPARKRPLPSWPRSVGVITSSTGAALHDICKVIAGRCPTRVLLCHAVVQGSQAPASLVSALKRLGARNDVDVIILGRGGGSMEDLWCFNDEALVRAVADCPIPVVSAVGHEIDTTLVDGVSDQRAATPSHAGELVVPDLRAREARLDQLGWQLKNLVARLLIDRRADLDRNLHRLSGQARALLDAPSKTLAAHHQRLCSMARRWAPARGHRLNQFEHRLLELHPRAQLAVQVQRRVELTHRLERAMRAKLEHSERRFSAMAAALHALSPLQVLGRGYALARDESGKVVRSAAQLQVDQALELRFAQGRAQVQVKSLSPEVSQ